MPHNHHTCASALQCVSVGCCHSNNLTAADWGVSVIFITRRPRRVSCEVMQPSASVAARRCHGQRQIAIWSQPNTTRRHKAVSMLGRRRRRRLNIETTLGQRIVLIHHLISDKPCRPKAPFADIFLKTRERLVKFWLNDGTMSVMPAQYWNSVEYVSRVEIKMAIFARYMFFSTWFCFFAYLRCFCQDFFAICHALHCVMWTNTIWANLKISITQSITVMKT